MRILYVGSLGPGQTAEHRRWALERLGHEVVPLNADDYQARNGFLRKLEFRSQIGPGVLRFNHDIVSRAGAIRPDVAWFDKTLSLQPSTIDRLRQMGIKTVSYMIDNVFGPRGDPGWRLYRKCIAHHDLHVTQRDRNVEQYRGAGARDVVKIQTAFEPSLHFPPPPSWSDADRDRDASFIGSPYDDRAERLQEVVEIHGQPVDISGNRRAWERRLPPDLMARLFRSDELPDAAYREGIWRSKINIAFVTRANEDEFAHKAFEIAACGGFLLAEDVPGHRARFVADEEAVFFRDTAELAAKIARYLPDEAARTRIAAAGRARAVASGYDNDTQVARILAAIAPSPSRPIEAP